MSDNLFEMLEAMFGKPTVLSVDDNGNPDMVGYSMTPPEAPKTEQCTDEHAFEGGDWCLKCGFVLPEDPSNGGQF